MKKLVIGVIGGISVLAGCSTKQIYELGQSYQQEQCIKYATNEMQYNDCVNMDRKSFEEYEEERKGDAKN